MTDHNLPKPPFGSDGLNSIYSERSMSDTAVCPLWEDPYIPSRDRDASKRSMEGFHPLLHLPGPGLTRSQLQGVHQKFLDRIPIKTSELVFYVKTISKASFPVDVSGRDLVANYLYAYLTGKHELFSRSDQIQLAKKLAKQRLAHDDEGADLFAGYILGALTHAEEATLELVMIREEIFVHPMIYDVLWVEGKKEERQEFPSVSASCVLIESNS